MSKEAKPEGLALLRVPFPPHHISKLPKPTKKQTEDVRADFKKGTRCKICGAWHHPDVVHLDYVGHAALTDRLLDCDPKWTWEPCVKPGLPDPGNGMWIELTVCGVSRIGYGSADGKSGGDAIKEIIGDGLRNAAMRFGAALDLWHKGDLHLDASDEGAPETRDGHSQEDAVNPPADNYAFPAGPAKGITELKAMTRALWREISGCGDLGELEPLLVTDENKAIIEQCMGLENPAHREIWEGDGKDNPGLNGFIQRRRDELAQIDEFGDVAPALSDADWSKLAQLMEATNSNATKMLKALSINVPTLDDLDAAQYDVVIDALERKLGKMAKKQTTAEYLGDEIKY